MRVTSELWVAALVRRVFSAGDFAAVTRRGNSEAGAIFIVRRDRGGSAELYEPAMQGLYGDHDSDRKFVCAKSGLNYAGINERVARELRLDTDFWVVEVEVTPEKIQDLISITMPS